jgi:chorismate synthase
MLEEVGVDVVSHVVAIGGIWVGQGTVARFGDRERVDASPVRVLDAVAERAMIEAIEQAAAERDTLGGVIEVLGYGLPPGIGSHVHWDRRLDARLAGALASIQAIKAVEFGDGLAVAGRRGSEAHDEIVYRDGGFDRVTDRAGGIEGGMSTGQPIRMRAAMKPLSTLMQPLQTVDVDTKEIDRAFRERSDVCAVPAAGVVAEHMVAFVLADEMQRKFGGDTIGDLYEAVEAYRRRLAGF